MQAEDVRDFNADTPGRSFTPYTVAQGYFQLESDLVHVTSAPGSLLIESLDPVLKYGLSDDVDIELETDGLLAMATTANGRATHQTGYGDMNPAVKWNIFGNDWQVFSAALRAGVKLPTASRGLGNGAFEYYLVLPSQFALPLGLSLQLQQEIDLLKNQADTGKHFSYGEDISLSRTFGKVTVSLEAFAQSGTDPNTHALYTADIGVGYALSPVVVLSFGTYFGLNNAAPSVEGYTGFAFRF